MELNDNKAFLARYCSIAQRWQLKLHRYKNKRVIYLNYMFKATTGGGRQSNNRSEVIFNKKENKLLCKIYVEKF